MDDHQLSKQFTPGSVITYALPTVFTMLFMALYMMVDGIFVARFVNEDAFTAINIVYPLISGVLALGLMLSMGSSAVIGKLLGEGEEATARSFFTQIYGVGIALGGLASALCLLFPHQLLTWLQASDVLYDYAKDYLFFTALFFVPSILQVYTQSFFITNGKPMLGFGACFLGGVTNIVLDYLFIGVMDLGIAGAGLATGIGYAVPGLFGLVYFALSRRSTLHFVKFRWDWDNLLQSCGNGMSEFVTNLAVAITTFLFNVILLDLEGEAGVAAITAILYVQMFQMAVYIGFSFGVAPVVSYKYGAQDWPQLQKIVRVSFVTLGISSLGVIAFSYLAGETAIGIFIPPTSDTFPLAKRGLLIYSMGYLFMGINVFMSSFFTALSNGRVSATLSCSRTLVFIVVCLFTLPQFLGTDGVWLAVPIAELLSFFLSVYYFKKYQSTYHYWGKDT